MAYKPEEKNKIFTEICDLIEDGKSLRQAIEIVNKIPKKTFLEWRNNDPAKGNQYARAREDSADTDADYVKETGDKVEAGLLTPDQARVIIDARKWSAGVKKPKKYGKQIDVTSGGDKIAAPGIITVQIVPPEEE